MYRVSASSKEIAGSGAEPHRSKQLSQRFRTVRVLGLSAVLAMVPASSLSPHEAHSHDPHPCQQSSSPSRLSAPQRGIGFSTWQEEGELDPAAACLATLEPDCVDFGSPHGLSLCLNYGISSVRYMPGLMETFIGITVGPDEHEFYVHTLATPTEQCEQHLNKLREAAELRLSSLPAFAGTLVAVYGLTTDCLSDSRRHEINGASAG